MIEYKYDEYGCICIFIDGSLRHVIQPGSHLLSLVPDGTVIEAYAPE